MTRREGARLHPGDVVLVKGVGVGHVTDERAKLPARKGGRALVQVSVELRDRRQVWVPEVRAHQAVRPLIDHDLAEELLARLREGGAEASARPWKDRHHELMGTLISGDAEEQVELLRGFYALPGPLSYGDLKAIHTLEENVLDEIATVMGLGLDALVAEMRRAHPATAQAARADAAG